MPDFEQPTRQPILSLEEAKAYSADTARVAVAVQSLFNSDGWKLFTTRFAQKRAEIEAYDAYQTIEDFHSDRRALRIVDELITELASYIDDATRANDLFTKLIAADQTPRTTDRLSTGDSVEA